MTWSSARLTPLDRSVECGRAPTRKTRRVYDRLAAADLLSARAQDLRTVEALDAIGAIECFRCDDEAKAVVAIEGAGGRRYTVALCSPHGRWETEQPLVERYRVVALRKHGSWEQQSIPLSGSFQVGIDPIPPDPATVLDGAWRDSDIVERLRNAGPVVCPECVAPAKVALFTSTTHGDFVSAYCTTHSEIHLAGGPGIRSVAPVAQLAHAGWVAASEPQ